MVAVAAQRLQDYFDKTSLVGGAGGFGQEAVGLRGEEVEGDDGSGETAWQRWERVFGEVEEREAMLTSLQFQLDDLVGDEDFTAAAKLQAAIRAVEDQDAMAAVFRELKAAVAEERYGDAKHLRDDAGAGLVGWWAGLDESGSADPFGRLVHVSQQHGKLLAKSYTAKQLSVAGQGIPIFEVYVARNAANPKRYDRQAVYLHHETATMQAKGASTTTTNPPPSTSASNSSSASDAAPSSSSPSSSTSASAPSTPPSSVQRVQDAVSFSWGKKQTAEEGKVGDPGTGAGAGEKGGISSQSPADPASGQASPSPVPPTPPPSPSAASFPPSSPSSASSASSPPSSLPPGADDSLSRVLDFFRERLPDVKLRVFPVVSPADVAAPDGSGAAGTADIPRIVEDVVKRIARDRESAAAAAAGEAAASAAAGEGAKEGGSGSDSDAGDGVEVGEGLKRADGSDDASEGIVPGRGDTSEGESRVQGPSSVTPEADGGVSEAVEVGEAAAQSVQSAGAGTGAGSRVGGADDPRRASQLPERDLRRLRAFRERNGMLGEGSGDSRNSSASDSSNSSSSSSSSSRGESGRNEDSGGLDREGSSGGRGGVGGGQGEGGAERSDGEEGSEDAEGRQGIAVRVVVGGVFPGDGAGESVSKVPARIEWRGKDAFVLTVEDSEGDGDAASSSSGSTGTSATDPAASQSPSSSPSSSSQSAAVAAAVSERLASAATRAAANLMPEDVAKQLWGVDRFSGPEVFKDKDVAQLIRTAVQHVQRRRYTLPRTTAFTRIHAADASTDPFAGLYVGAYGPYTSEAIQVRRRFGTWEEPEGEEQESQAGKAGERVGGRKRQGERALVPPFEYVEGVKLTGDFNVPAGKVSFRAKIRRHWQMPFRGVYPDELGVVARYPGQGQLAEPGFKNPRWVDGELLVFDGKGSRHTNGAELGFVFSLPERHFLILFNRLKLQA
ncbi:unnamed protein product [Closterium sp. Naga37s-1]|nr:unnamed protein product [Closterium sp. Naga37s-1]